jgi:thiamine-phosphate pyrophosphorylase
MNKFENMAMSLVVITPPEIIPDETLFIKQLIDNGIYRVHIRKPRADLQNLRNYLLQITPQYRANLVIHYYPELVEEFGLAGFHYNNSNIQYSDNHFFAHKSYSAHSTSELLAVESKNLIYTFLSPIFDSISKQGYRHAFELAQLALFFKNRQLNNQVFALGGINENNIDILESIGFQGAALLGSVWNRFQNKSAADSIAYLNKIRILCNHTR